MMDAVEMILRRNEALVKENLRLQRKLGRMAYWRNAHRKQRDKEQKRVLELEATVAELQASLNAKLAEEVSRA